ncbi:MAG: SoxR reducing system RseC family protein [Methylococcaceae bacterium]
MIEESAVVVKIDNRQVWVTSAQSSACGGCSQKAGCTTQTLASILNKKPVPVDSNLSLTIGDTVIVAIDEGLLLRASILLYLLPLIGLFAGAGVADWLLADNHPYAELSIAGSAVLSLLLALLLINKVQNLLLFNYYARPVVVKKL